jgi:WD40 repeat protein/energy-coupling factor transporter ATP-binding protein EcfA2
MTRYALVVGISKYDQFTHLPKAATDAEAIAQLLEQHRYTVIRLPRKLVSETQWAIDPDKKLTASELSAEVKVFLRERATRQAVVIYFAGHSFRVTDALTDEEVGYLATSDSTREGHNAVRVDALNTLINKSDLGSLVMLLDCCYAGSLIAQRSLLQPTQGIISQKQNYCLIAACRDFERAREGEQHGIFTTAVLQGLSPKNAVNGEITSNDLFGFVSRKLRTSGQEVIYAGLGLAIPLLSYQTQPEMVTAIVDEQGEIICPYQGLQAFTAKQRPFFFGRKQIIEAIRQKLEQQAFVPVIGASGSGKSSVVRAGLMPWLEESGWRILEPIQPGFEPLAALRAVFKPFLKRSQSEMQALQQWVNHDPAGLAGVMERMPSDERYLLVVDQFEELFTVCADEAERQRFIALITQVAETQNSRLAVVTTMRADFLEPCLHYPSLHHLIQAQAVFMPPLIGLDLRDVITEPAKCQGYPVEEALLLKILEDVGKEPGFLPLLEFALTKLWEKRDREKHLLTLEHYENLHGLTGALNLHAERVYHYRDYESETPVEKRDAQEQDWIRKILLRLVRTGEREKDTRQRQPKAKLLAITGNDPEKQAALRELLDGAGGLVQGRLLVAGKDGQAAEWVDLAHETLIDGWQRFAEWRKEDRDLRRLSDRLEDALREWQKAPDAANLMMGGLLAQVRERWEDLQPVLQSPEASEFYRQSDAHERDRITELEQALAQAELREQVGQSLNLLPVQPHEGAILAIRATGVSLEKLQGVVLPPIQGCLRQVIDAVRERNCLWLQTSVKSIAFSPDGQMIVSGGDHETLQVWDLQGNPIGPPFQGHQASVLSVACSPDGQMIASGSDDRTVRLWDWQGNPIGLPFEGHQDSVRSVSFSPDGQMIASGSDDKTVRLWDLQGHPIGHPFEGHSFWVRSVAFSPNGQTIVSGSDDKTLRLWDLQGNSMGSPFMGHQAGVLAVAFSPNGQTIASGSDDKMLRLWDLQGNAMGSPFAGHQASVLSVAFSFNGQLIISGSADETVRLWDVQGNPIGHCFQGHRAGVLSVACAPDGQTIASSSNDETVRLWDVQGNSIGQPFEGHLLGVSTVAFAADNQTILSGSIDGTLRLWDLQGNSIGQPFEGHEASVSSVACSPKGQMIASGSADQTLRLWDLQGHSIGQPFAGHQGSVCSVAFSLDGQMLVSGSDDKTLRLWDLQGNLIGHPFEGHQASVLSIACSPNGQMIVSGSADQTLRLWDLQGHPIGQPFAGHQGSVCSVACSPNGQMLVSGSDDKTLRLWDLQGNLIGQPFAGHQDSVLSVAFSPDSQMVISGSADKTLRLWDLQGNAIGPPLTGHQSRVLAVAFSPNGQMIVSGSADQTLRLWRGGAWQDWLTVCCNRLRHHPSLKNCATEDVKAAYEVCRKYVWERR